MRYHRHHHNFCFPPFYYYYIYVYSTYYTVLPDVAEGDFFLFRPGQAWLGLAWLGLAWPGLSGQPAATDLQRQREAPTQHCRLRL